MPETIDLKPEVRFDTFEHIDEVYDWYAHREIDQKKTIDIHAKLAKVLRPKVLWTPGGEDQVGEFLEDGGQLVWIQNHISNWDPFTLAAMAFREKVFKPALGKINILAKEDWYHHRPTELLFDKANAIPMSRFKDKNDEVRSLELRKYANQKALETVVSRMTNFGEHSDTLATGHRIKENPRTVPELKPGFKIIYKNALEAGLKVAILPTIFWCGENAVYRALVGGPHPNMAMGPLLFPSPDDDSIDKAVRPAMQANLDYAIVH